MSPVQCLKKKLFYWIWAIGGNALAHYFRQWIWDLRWSIFVAQGDECNPGCGKQAVVSGDNLVMCLSLKVFKVFCENRSFKNFPDFLNTCVEVFFKSCGPSYLKLLQKNVVEPIYWEKTHCVKWTIFTPNCTQHACLSRTLVHFFLRIYLEDFSEIFRRHRSL